MGVWCGGAGRVGGWAGRLGQGRSKTTVGGGRGGWWLVRGGKRVLLFVNTPCGRTRMGFVPVMSTPVRRCTPRPRCPRRVCSACLCAWQGGCPCLLPGVSSPRAFRHVPTPPPAPPFPATLHHPPPQVTPSGVQLASLEQVPAWLQELHAAGGSSGWEAADADMGAGGSWAAAAAGGPARSHPGGPSLLPGSPKGARHEEGPGRCLGPAALHSPCASDAAAMSVASPSPSPPTRTMSPAPHVPPTQQQLQQAVGQPHVADGGGGCFMQPSRSGSVTSCAAAPREWVDVQPRVVPLASASAAGAAAAAGPDVAMAPAEDDSGGADMSTTTAALFGVGGGVSAARSASASAALGGGGGSGSLHMEGCSYAHWSAGRQGLLVGAVAEGCVVVVTRQDWQLQVRPRPRAARTHVRVRACVGCCVRCGCAPSLSGRPPCPAHPEHMPLHAWLGRAVSSQQAAGGLSQHTSKSRKTSWLNVQMFEAIQHSAAGRPPPPPPFL